MKNKEEQTAPKLRFKGYTDAWQQHKLSDIANIIGGGTPSTKNLSYWSGDINWYSPSEIGSSVYVNSSKIKISENGLKHSSAKLLPGNRTILFTSRAGIGNMAIMKTDGTTNQGFQSWIIDPLKTNIYFLYSMGNLIKKEALKKASGSTFLEISNSEVKKLEIKFPSKPEQDKIGELLSKLDKVVTLLQRKEEKYKTIKKSLLQNLFPEKNQIVPTLRLKGFNDDWQRRKLSEIVKTTIGEFIIKSKQKEDSPYPVYNGGTSYTGFYDNYNNCGDKIIISARGANAGFVNIVRQKYWAGNSCYSLSIINNQEVDLDYLYQMLKQKQHLFTDFQQAANIPSVSKKDVETFEICTSSFEEQKKIGLFLTKLDSLIVFLQKRITTFSNLKKFLLQNMFI